MGGMDIYTGDCLDVMRGLEADSVDSVVTDPPYGLKFMGKGWDHGVPGAEYWEEVLRVAKPGAYLLAFGGTRTFHRLAVAIEDSGWEIRDTIMWVYGSGFPKSHNVSKALDKKAGVEHPKNTLVSDNGSMAGGNYTRIKMDVQTDLAKQWDGWGTALKPSWEPVIVARKPVEGTVADNVTKWGTGGINIEGCRVGVEKVKHAAHSPSDGFGCRLGGGGFVGGTPETIVTGRWPANLIHDGSDEVVGLFPNGGASGPASGPTYSGKYQGNAYGVYNGNNSEPAFYNDKGSAARFFYCAKASKHDRDDGLDCEPKQYSHDGRNTPIENAYQRNDSLAKNHHPTVKPTNLMRYLCKLVTQPGGVVMDPFMGSGSTGKAAVLEGFDFIGIEKEPEYAEIAKARIASVSMVRSGQTLPMDLG